MFYTSVLPLLAGSLEQTRETEPASTADTANGTPRIQLEFHSPESATRAALELFIATRFRAAYGASIKEFFPLLLGRTNDQGITSALGLRPAATSRLFLEHYLDHPVESEVAVKTGARVNRDGIMEIGNLASSSRQGSQLLFILLTAILDNAGFEWVVFTATEQIRLLLKRLDFHPVILHSADSSRLPDGGRGWGTYYDSKPNVQAGHLPEAMSVLAGNPRAAAALAQHEDLVGLMSALLREQILSRIQPMTCQVETQ